MSASGTGARNEAIEFSSRIRLHSKPEGSLRPSSCWGSKAVRPRAPGPMLERQASDELERARRRGAVDGPESVSLRQIALRVVRQVGDRPIGQASEVHSTVEARELDLVQQVED